MGVTSEFFSKSTMVFFIVGCLLVAQVLSLPAPDGAVGHGGHGSYDEHPDPFHFEYGVHDDKYHTDFSEQRTGDETGSMKGEYTVALPDGRIQHVTYHADGGYGGTVMEVTYKVGRAESEIIGTNKHSTIIIPRARLTTPST